MKLSQEYFIICLILLGLCGCDTEAERTHILREPYQIDYPNLKPSNVRKHIKWVGVPGGQISVDKYDKILEFVGIGGKRYKY